MNLLDSTIIIGYFAFIIISALIFRRFTNSSSGFIRGGGAMMWWMAGATAFMTQFSAWTFTGAAAKAYEDGFAILFLFWGNALGFFVAAAYFAARYRQLRVETAMEVIRVRFGRTAEQVYTWFSFPLTTISAAVWLNGLAIFVAAVFNIDLYITILFIGVLVIFIAVSGGSWTVSATNVIQLILLMAITLTVGIFALVDVGGPIALVENSTIPSYMGANINYWQIFLLWGCAILFQQTISINNTLTCYRFLVTTNEKEAQKAALVAGVLFIIGPVMWFIPPWVSSTFNVNLHDIYPNLGAGANSAAYLYYIEHHMPRGMLGLVLAAMIAATISPMTTTLNRNAGIFVRNVYQSIVSSNSTDKQQLMVGRWATIISGIISIITALLFASIKEYSFFDIMMFFSAFVQAPLTIPSLLGLVIYKTPDWSGCATICVGLLVSLLMKFIFEVDWLLPLFNASSFTHREQVDLTVVATLIAQMAITGGFFFSTRYFYKKPIGKRGEELDLMFHHLKTPIAASEEAQIDHRQGYYLGRLSMALGILVAILGLFLAETRAVTIFTVIGGIILFSGWYLYYRAKGK